MTAEAMLDMARSQLGYKAAGDGTSMFGVWFAGVVGDPAYKTGDFCAMFQLWAADRSGQLEVLGGAEKAWAWVPSWWAHWKQIGRSGLTPRIGALVFFDFNRSGDPEHVGIVESISLGGLLHTIEANTLGGQVLRRTRYRADVLGYGYPDYASTVTPGGDDCWMG